MEKKKNKNVKKNPIMRDQKVKNMKIDNMSESPNEIKTFVIIIIIIAILIGVIYGVTELLKDEPEATQNATTGEIDYNKVSVGTILNRPNDVYYVLIYNSEDDDAILYSTILTKYMQKQEYAKIYFCDLNSILNAKYKDKNNDGKSNPQAKEISEFDFGKVTLIKVEEGKITKYIENFEEIKDMLS